MQCVAPSIGENSNDNSAQMKSTEKKKKDMWCGGSQSMALHQPMGDPTFHPFTSALGSQWQAQVQAIPRAITTARGAVGLVQQMQRPVLVATPLTSWGYPNSWMDLDGLWWFIWKSIYKWMINGVPLFSETPRWLLPLTSEPHFLATACQVGWCSKQLLMAFKTRLWCAKNHHRFHNL